MLPKVANHILHQTTRAAAAVQSHSTHTIRNVLRTDTTTNLTPWKDSTSSSNWGHNGPGPGGPRYNAGSRFQSGYTGAGRAVTHANAITSHDSTHSQNDDNNEEFSTKRVSLIHRPKGKSPRIRSHSLSFNAQDRHDRGETLGVLETVQIHARSRHAFAQQPSSSFTTIAADVAPSAVAEAPKPVLVRRNSTSVPADRPSSPVPPLPASPPPPELSRPPTDPAAPQTTAPPELSPSPPDENDQAVYKALRAARDSGDPAHASTVVSNFLASAQNPSVAEFNMALEALHETRRPGEPLTRILETYNALLSHSLLPNVKTYFILILALTDRDHEVHRMIHSLTVRGEKKVMSGNRHPDSPQLSLDQARIEQLKKENNFGSALSLFEAAIAIDGNSKLPGVVYNNLLRACSYHASVDSAIHVFAQLEARQDIKPSALTYLYMMSTYTNAGDASGARAVFDEFLAASKENRLVWTVAPSKPSKEPSYDPSRPVLRSHASRNVQLQIWNKMIEASFRANPPVPVDAINLVETMLNSTAQPLFGPADIPPPASSTYTTVINGFVGMGDLDSALRWFDHLLSQADPPRNPFESTKRPVRPDVVAWMTMIDALAFASAKEPSRVDDLNRLFKIFCENANRDGLEVRHMDRLVVFQANMNLMRDAKVGPSERETFKGRLDFLVEYVLSDNIPREQNRGLVREIMTVYINLGYLNSAIYILDQHIVSELSILNKQRTEGGVTPVEAEAKLSWLQSMAVLYVDDVYRSQKGELSFGAAIELSRVLDKVGVLPSLGGQAAQLLHAYGLSKRDGQLVIELSVRDWELLAYAATELELPRNDGTVPPSPQIQGYAFTGGVTELLEDMARNGVDLQQLHKLYTRRMVQAIFVNKGVDELKAVFTRLGPAYEQFLANPDRELDALAEAVTESPVSESDNASYETTPSGFTTPPPSHPAIRINPYTTNFVDELLQVTKDSRKPDPLNAFSRYESELQKGVAPGPAVLGRLIQGLGRLGEVDKVRDVYTTAQRVLMSLEHNKKWQSQAWFMVEDSMIIALAHAGDIDSAHVHRLRILEHGGAPTADAYGALILYVKDTTDDTSNAMALFQEAQAQNVAPNLYLYNNIISKLAKARKADYALELFQEMKALHIRPSSITYGALIGACARVGDVHSAEILFDEMTKQGNFKPRIPPYNTMMQLYTTTKPNRERALFYYDALLRNGIRPTSHTYKLLLDAYGTIEPVDVTAMEDVFNHLENDPSVEIQGAHWASLINAWGCVVKDLSKAIEIFDSIASHPSTAKSSIPLPDAVVFEAMINVLVAHRRMDMVPHFMEKLNEAGIHMTAYIANCLIKGYAITGDLMHARSIFESLQDPPEGVAAPHNHAPHQPGQSTKVELMAPVYREPSTWEVMVRAELGAGNRSSASALLERLQARHYPEAVYNRISGIMLDHTSTSPWSSP